MTGAIFRGVLILMLASFVVPGSAHGSSAPASMRQKVLAALRARDPQERTRGLERALNGADSKEAALLVLDVVLPRARGEVEATIGVFTLAQMEDGAAIVEIGKRAAAGDLRERVLAIESLGRSSAGLAANSALVPLLGDPDARIRAAAVTALGERHADALDDLLVEPLSDPEWTVVSAAVTALARQGKESAVPHLSATMRRAVRGGGDGTGAAGAAASAGRIVDDCVVALEALSGQRFGADPVRYERWWAKRLSEEGVTPSEPGTDDDGDGDGGTESGPLFAPPPDSFRSPLVGARSRRLLFVLCTGETMEEKIDPARVSAPMREALEHAGKDLVDDLEDARTKLALAQIHLRAMIRSLDDGVEFDVLTYASSASFAFGKPTKADAASRRKAESRVARLSPSGGGNLEDALRRAFDPKGKDPLGTRVGPDTVVLLSDGHLREPGNTDRLAVSQGVRRWNRVRQVRFLVIAVGHSDSSVLGPLAAGPPRGASAEIP